MPRKNQLKLGVVSPLPQFQRPPPPPEFTTAEAKVWDQVVKAKRPDWYSESFGALLRSFCATVVMADELQAEIRKVSLEEAQPRYLRLAREHRNVARFMAQLAAKLRLAPSSSRPPREQELRRHPKPWEPDSA